MAQRSFTTHKLIDGEVGNHDVQKSDWALSILKLAANIVISLPVIVALISLFTVTVFLLFEVNLAKVAAGDVAYLKSEGQRLLDFAVKHGALITTLIAALTFITGGVWLAKLNQAQETFRESVNKHLGLLTKQAEMQVEAIKAQTKANSDQAYTELDRLYSQILTLAVERPHLRGVNEPPDAFTRDLNLNYKAYDHAAAGAIYLSDLALPVSRKWTLEEAGRYLALESSLIEHKETQYDAYAFMVWNFLETIHDRCESDPEALLNTWAPVVAAENAIHRGWFLREMAKELENESAAKRSGAAYVPTHKFCRDFQLFILEGNFREVGNSTPAMSSTEKYPNWSYFEDHPAWKSGLPANHEPVNKRKCAWPQKDNEPLWNI